MKAKGIEKFDDEIMQGLWIGTKNQLTEYIELVQNQNLIHMETENVVDDVAMVVMDNWTQAEVLEMKEKEFIEMLNETAIMKSIKKKKSWVNSVKIDGRN